MLDRAQGEGMPDFVSERVLGFGLSMSSNVAQHFAHAIVSLIRSRFDAEEARAGLDPVWTPSGRSSASFSPFAPVPRWEVTPAGRPCRRR